MILELTIFLTLGGDFCEALASFASGPTGLLSPLSVRLSLSCSSAVSSMAALSLMNSPLFSCRLLIQASASLLSLATITYVWSLALPVKKQHTRTHNDANTRTHKQMLSSAPGTAPWCVLLYVLTISQYPYSMWKQLVAMEPEVMPGVTFA